MQLGDEKREIKTNRQSLRKISLHVMVKKAGGL
jgi:hypothetical protein